MRKSLLLSVVLALGSASLHAGEAADPPRDGAPRMTSDQIRARARANLADPVRKTLAIPPDNLTDRMFREYDRNGKIEKTDDTVLIILLSIQDNNEAMATHRYTPAQRRHFVETNEILSDILAELEGR